MGKGDSTFIVRVSFYIIDQSFDSLNLYRCHAVSSAVLSAMLHLYTFKVYGIHAGPSHLVHEYLLYCKV